VDGIPILINEKNSVFDIGDYQARRNTTFDLHRGKLQEIILGLPPRITANVMAKQNFQRLAEMLHSPSGSSRVLVIGGSILGEGMETLLDYPHIQIIDADVSFGPRTMLICDGHDLPFEDQSFDGVVAQAVLEHVVDPYRCVSEIHRVLKPGGLVYAETPFMQQVHMGRYDFTRFTHLGHRRLFRWFDEIDSGAMCGPGMALAWSYQYFLYSLTRSNIVRKLLRIFASFTAFYLKYFDYYLIRRPAALDAAAACYFLGRKAEYPLCDRELLKLYRGAMR